MANNEYVNRVDFGGETLIDISDTTAEPEDVIEGQTFYTKSGAPATGTLGDATTTTHGLMSAADKVKLDEMDSKKAPIIIDFKSGNLIVISDGVPGLKPYDMKVSFTSKQAGSGDPSPTNIRSITGLTGINIYRLGKNIFNKDAIDTNKGYVLNNYLTVNGDESGSPNYDISEYISVVPETNYTISGISGGNPSICFYDSEKNFISGSSYSGFTSKFAASPSNAMYCRVSVPKENVDILQLEVGEIATAYEPYSGIIIPISWQSEAGTIYGGELNVLTGILTVNMVRADMGSATWTIGTNGNVHWFKSSRILTGAKILSSNSYAAHIVSDRFKNIQAAKIYSGEADDNTIAQESVSLVDSNLRVKATSYNDDTDAFKAAMDGVYVYYELATPLTYQLTPIQITLLTGTNTIWTDADNIQITYPVDTKKYVDAGVRDVQTAGTSILQDGIADIPFATSAIPGIVKIGNGVGMSSSGQIRINSAGDSYLKAGSDLYYPVVPGRQHTSVFYALAKLAGVDLANETVTVGQYPNSAQNAIKAMLGITEIPAATSTDEGKVLRVVNGEWSAVSLPSVSEVSW